MGMLQIMYLLLSLILFENYFILKKYKSIFLNIITIIYVVSVPFYCFVPMPHNSFLENFMTYIAMIMFVLIFSLTPLYALKLSKKESKKYPIYGLGWIIFFIVFIIFRIVRL